MSKFCKLVLLAHVRNPATTGWLPERMSKEQQKKWHKEFYYNQLDVNY